MPPPSLLLALLLALLLVMISPPSKPIMAGFGIGVMAAAHPLAMADPAAQYSGLYSGGANNDNYGGSSSSSLTERRPSAESPFIERMYDKVLVCVPQRCAVCAEHQPDYKHEYLVGDLFFLQEIVYCPRASLLPVPPLFRFSFFFSL
jgi:hypothetical protein